MLTFFGYTGVGKSTQIELLAHSLELKGLRVKQAYVKIYYPLTRLLLKYYGEKDPNPRWISNAPCRLGAPRARLFRSSITFDLTINIFPLLIVSIFKLRIFLLLKYIVLVEEYLLEIITDYMHAYGTCRLNFRLVNVLINVLVRFISKETTIVILVANRSSLEERWIERKTVFEHPEYLKTQRAVIEFCRKHMDNCICIETDNKSITEVHRELLSRLSAQGW